MLPKMMLCADGVAAGRRRLHIKAVCHAREATTRSGVDNAASPDWADTAERDYFTLREVDHYAKQPKRNPEHINEQCR